jgi:hypothetical protein
VGNALGIESDVLGTEQRAGDQEREMSTTEPETDATMSDVGAKMEGDNAHGGEMSGIDIVDEDVNEEIKQERIFEKEQVTKGVVFPADVDNINLCEIVHENKFQVGVSSFTVSRVGNEESNANFTSFTVREASLLEATRKKVVPEDVCSDNKGLLYKKEGREVGVESSYRKEIGVSENHIVVRDNVMQKVTEIGVRSKKTEEVQETVEEKESPEVSSYEDMNVLRQKDVAEVDLSITGREEKEKEINEQNGGCENTTASSCEAICENVAVQIGVPFFHFKTSRGIAKDRTESLIQKETGEERGRIQSCYDEVAECPSNSEFTSSEVKERQYKNGNVTVGTSVAISDVKIDRNSDAEIKVSRPDSKAENVTFDSEATEYNALHSSDDSASVQPAPHAQKNTEERLKEFESSNEDNEDMNSRHSVPDVGIVDEFASPLSEESSYGTATHLSIKTSGVFHETCDQISNAEPHEHETVEHSSEATVSEESTCVKTDEECAILSEMCSTTLISCKDGSDLAEPCGSGSFKTSGNIAQSNLYNYADGDTDVICAGTSSASSTDERVFRISEFSADGGKRENEPQQITCPVSEQSSLECRAVVVEAGGEEVWEEVGELCGAENTCVDDGPSENAVPGGDGGYLPMMNNQALLQDAKLSQEEKELLDSRPLIDAEDEETLRRFLHSLNLADYSKEAVRARSATLRDGTTIDDIYATRRGKRRAPLETYSSQQRGLEVILEENSSDYSEGEKRVEEARALEDRPRHKAWEEAVFIPETNQLVFLSNDSDEEEYETLDNRRSGESMVRNRSVYYSESKVMTEGMEKEKIICHGYQRVENKSISLKKQTISEEVNVDVFSEDMEQALENAGETEECDSEDSREERVKAVSDGDVEVRVELAESSEEEEEVEEVKGTWKRGRTRERQDTVEIVYLEEDSGSTSSGSCIAAKKIEDEAAEDADGEEEDPDVLYEAVEFPVVGAGEVTGIMSEVVQESSETNTVNAIYENVEFHGNTKTQTKQTDAYKGNPSIPLNLQGSSQCSDVDEPSACVYENVEFIRKETLNSTSTQPSFSVSVACSEISLMHLADNSNVIPDGDSRPKDYNAHAFRGNDDREEVTKQLRITDTQNPANIGIVGLKSEVETIRQSVTEIESSSELESRAEADTDTNMKEDLRSGKPYENTEITDSTVEIDKHCVEHEEDVAVSNAVNVDNSQKNVDLKTVDIVKRILSLMPQRENIDIINLESIISQLNSGNSQTESLKENVAGRLAAEVSEENGGHQHESNEKSARTPSQIDSDNKSFNDSVSCEGMEHDLNLKIIQNYSDSKLPVITEEPDTNHRNDAYVETIEKCDINTQKINVKSVHNLSFIDSHINTLNECTPSRQSESNLDPKTAQGNPDFNSPNTTLEPDISRGNGIYIEQERPIIVSGESGNLRDDDDGLDDVDSITPTNRSRHGSSSSDAGSHGTAVYCPGRFSPQSSDADISSYAEDSVTENKALRKIYSPLNIRNKLSKSHSHENISESKKYLAPTFKNWTEIHNKMSASPKTLKDLSIDRVVSLPHGVDILNVLGIRVPLRNTEEQRYGKEEDMNPLMQDVVRKFQLLNAPSPSASCTIMGKLLFSGSLPDISSMQQESLLRDQSSDLGIVKSPPPVLSAPSLAEGHWIGMPTKDDPSVLVCLSPSQRQSYHQGEIPTPEEAGNLLDLHQKFIQRRGYHENPPPPPSRRASEMCHSFNEAPFSNRYFRDKSLSRKIECQRPSSSGGEYVETKETSTAFELIPSPRFRTVLTSLDSKIHSEGSTRDETDGLEGVKVEEKGELGARVNEDKEENGGGERERDCGTIRSTSSSRLLAILRDSSEPQEIQASSSCSPPPLPPLPHAYQYQLDMLGFLQHNRRPASICCTSNHSEFDSLLHLGPPRSPSCNSQSSRDSEFQSPTLKVKSDVKVSNPIEGVGNKKERVSSWYGQGMSDINNKERLKVRSLSDWLQLVRCGGSSKDTDEIQSKASTPPASGCLSTQSSPGPIRRVMKDPFPKPETQEKKHNGMKEHQKLKQEILERRFSLPERQLEEAYQPDKKLVKTPLLPTSARDDERHEQQLRLLQQRQQQLRNQQLANKTESSQEKRPPLPQQQSKQKQTETEVKTKERRSPVTEDQKQQSIILQEKHHVERRFDADNYRISKKGDIAIINSNSIKRVSKEEQSILKSKEIEDEISKESKTSQRPKSMPPPTESVVTGGEIFRQQMYLEYMNKVAERAERRRHKVIRLSSVPHEDAPVSEMQDTASAATVHQLENEFMGRVRERMDKLGLKYDEESDDGIQNKTESGTNNCYVITGGGGTRGIGGGGTSVSQLPKHLQEFLVIAGGAGTDSDVSSDVDGELTLWCVRCVCLLSNIRDIFIATRLVELMKFACEVFLS